MKKNIKLSGLDELDSLVAFRKKGFKTKDLKKNRTVKVRSLKTLCQMTAALVAFVFSIQVSLAQEYRVAPTSTITVKGTSTMHDWESISKTINGKVSLDKSNNGAIQLNSLELSVPVKSLESGKSRMDRLTHDAFKESSHPTIEFRLRNVEVLSNGQAVATGTLIMAGTSKVEKVKGQLKQSGGRIIITGSHPIDMTTYNMEPPTAMMGAVKVGKDVTVDFNIILNK